MTDQVQYLALGGDPDHYGLLPTQALDLWRSIEKYRNTQWKDPTRRDELMRIGGCLDKLSASLLQINRLRAHHDHLLEMARSPVQPGAHSFALRGLSALADFEGLLLQGRAALDRLTWFLTSSYYPANKTRSFRKLRKALSNAGKGDDARPLLAILGIAEPWFNDVLATLDSPESLRDLVGHKHAIAEGIETCFAVTYLSLNTALAFDCEVRLPGLPTMPLLRSACHAAQHLSFTVLNSLAVVTSTPTLPAEAFQSTWALRTVVRSDFLVDEPDDSPKTENTLSVVQRLTPDGLEMSTRNYRPAIREHVITL